MHLRCAGMRPVLSRVLDQEGPSRELERAAKHVRQCEICKAELEALGRMRRLLGQLPRVRVGPHYEQSFAVELSASKSGNGRPDTQRALARRTATRKRILFGVATALVMSASAIWFSLGAPGNRKPAVVSLRGPVDVMTSKDGKWLPAQAGVLLAPGDAVRAAGGGQFDIALGNRYEIRVRGDTDGAVVRLVSGDHTPPVYELTQGIAVVSARKAGGRGKLSFLTPSALTAVQGTRFFVEVREQGKTRVAVDEGTVLVRSRAKGGEGRGAEVVVREREQTEVWPNAAPSRPRSWRGLVFVGRLKS